MTHDIAVPHPGAPAPGCWYPGFPCRCGGARPDCMACDGLGEVPACKRCGVAPADPSDEECTACAALPKCLECGEVAVVEGVLCHGCSARCPECMTAPCDPVVLSDGASAGRWCAHHVGKFAVETVETTLDDNVLAAALVALDRYVAARRLELPRRLRVRAAGGAR